MSNSWSTSSQPDFVRALGRRKTVRNRQGKICTRSCSKVGQLLVTSSPTPHPVQSCRGLPCNSPLGFGNTRLNPPRVNCRKWVFLQKNSFSYREMHFPTEKCTFLQKMNLSCRRMRFSGGGGAHGRKPQEIARGFQGSR